MCPAQPEQWTDEELRRFAQGLGADDVRRNIRAALAASRALRDRFDQLLEDEIELVLEERRLIGDWGSTADEVDVTGPEPTMTLRFTPGGEGFREEFSSQRRFTVRHRSQLSAELLQTRGEEVPKLSAELPATALELHVVLAHTVLAVRITRAGPRSFDLSLSTGSPDMWARVQCKAPPASWEKPAALEEGATAQHWARFEHLLLGRYELSIRVRDYNVGAMHLFVESEDSTTGEGTAG